MSNSSAKPFGSPDRRSDGESIRSPYAPKRGREAGADPSRAGDDDPPPPRFLVSSRPDRDQDLTDFTEGSLQFHDDSPQERHMRRPAQSDRRGQAYGERDSEEPSDIDLQRLEESVRRLQREAAVNRPRSATEGALTPAHVEEGRGQRRRADTFIDGYRVPPSLQPEVLTPPAELREGHGRFWTLTSMLIASAVAAPIAYYFAAGSGSPPAADTRVASAETRPAVETLTVTAPAVPARPQRVQPPNAERKSAERKGAERKRIAAAPENVAPPVTVVPRRAAEPPPAQSFERTPPPAQSVEAVHTVGPLRKLDPAEIDVLIKQGQQFVAAGDFVTARLVFQRAAEAGNAVAALALGATYDPVVLSRLGVRGIDADVGKARAWYEKAKEFGAPDADRRLGALANR